LIHHYSRAKVSLVKNITLDTDILTLRIQFQNTHFELDTKMTKQIHILDKDATLEVSITTLQQKLLDAGFSIVEQSCLNPVVNVWSVHIRDCDCPLLVSDGKGASKKAALVSALGKFVERLSNHHFWADCYLGGEISNSKFVHFPKEKWFKAPSNGSWPYDVLHGDLDDELRNFYNPDGELNASLLIDTTSADRERGICCIPYECVRTGEMINFPINIVDNLYASNGMSAGNSVEEARLKALSEVLESYIKFKIIAEGISLPNITEEVLSRYPKIQAAINEVEAAGYALLLQDASLDGKYPVVVMALLNPKNQGVCVSFSAHPKFEVALERSLTGLFQGRGLDQLDGFAETGFDMDEIASPQNLEKHFIDSSGIVAWNFLNEKSAYEFVDWDKQDTSYINEDNNILVEKASEEFTQLCDLVHAEGNDIFISDHNEIGIYACRIIVPGMSEVYPIDDLVWENNNAGMDIRDQILKADKTLDECEQLIQHLEDLNLDDKHLVSKLIGMPADVSNIFEDLRVAELITLLALKTQDNERIQEGCEWLLHFQKINLHRLKTYQCINTILQLDGMTNYGSALEKLYSRPILNDALALIDGEDIFPLISDWKMYGLLIEAYKKMIKAQA